MTGVPHTCVLIIRSYVAVGCYRRPAVDEQLGDHYEPEVLLTHLADNAAFDVHGGRGSPEKRRRRELGEGRRYKAKQRASHGSVVVRVVIVVTLK